MATACTFYQTSNNISIIYQDSIITGEFLPSKNINIGFIPDFLKIGDLNDDGFNDIVISGSNTADTIFLKAISTMMPMKTAFRIIRFIISLRPVPVDLPNYG